MKSGIAFEEMTRYLEIFRKEMKAEILEACCHPETGEFNKQYFYKRYLLQGPGKWSGGSYGDSNIFETVRHEVCLEIADDLDMAESFDNCNERAVQDLIKRSRYSSECLVEQGTSHFEAYAASHKNVEFDS